jgi:hypothetical protein
MAITIIVKDGKPRGETRSAIDRKLVDAGWGSSFKDEAAADKCKFVERKLKRNLGVEDGMVPAAVYNRMGSEGKLRRKHGRD